MNIIYLTVFTMIFALISCKSGIVGVSSRPIVTNKNGEKKTISRPVVKPTPKPKIFIEKKVIRIDKKDPGLVSGSLYNISDPRNILVGDLPRAQVGSYIDIRIASHRLDKTKPDEQSNQSDDELEKTLLAALPNLDAGTDNPPLLKNIKLQVVQQLPNGDYLARYNQSSTNQTEANAINFQAIIPVSALNKKDPITTNDLKSVHWIESMDGQIHEAESNSWQDSYSLKLSGFNEAKSKTALNLEEKRKQLLKFRDNLKNNFETLTSERTKIAQERKRLSSERKRIFDENKDLVDKITEHEKTIADHEETIQELESERPLDPGEAQQDEASTEEEAQQQDQQ